MSISPVEPLASATPDPSEVDRASNRAGDVSRWVLVGVAALAVSIGLGSCIVSEVGSETFAVTPSTGRERSGQIVIGDLAASFTITRCVIADDTYAARGSGKSTGGASFEVAVDSLGEVSVAFGASTDGEPGAVPSYEAVESEIIVTDARISGPAVFIDANGDPSAPMQGSVDIDCVESDSSRAKS